MYSTTTLIKNSKFSGRILGTHQQLDLAARKTLGKILPRNTFFPTGREIIYFEGTRGPDGLKRKSPGVDEPSHMHIDENENITEVMMNHRYNLAEALSKKDQVRAAFEAAWMAHMVTDGLTPAHHFPLNEVKAQLMTDAEMVKVFGEPVKGVMHGRSLFETLRNNWLYWGAKGHMTQHVAYEYGVLMIAATMLEKSMIPKLTRADFEGCDFEKQFDESLALIKNHHMFDRFREEGWTTELAFETRDVLLPEIVKVIALGWYSAIAEAKGNKHAQK